MAYQRKNPVPQKEAHPLHVAFGGLGELSLHLDPPWIAEHLKTSHTELEIALTQLKNCIESVKGLDLSELKEEYALKKRSEPLLAARRALLSFIKKHIEEAQANVDATRNKALRMTEPQISSDPIKAMMQLKQMERMIQLVEREKPEHRMAYLRQHPEFLQALVNDPGGILSKENLEELRMEYALSVEPSLEMEINDAQALYKAVRKRSGEANSTAVKLLLKEKLEMAAEISPIEHFGAMPPQNQFEHAQAMKRIASWQKEEFQKAQRKDWEEKNKGVDLDSDNGLRRPRNAQQAEDDKAIRQGRSKA